MASLPSLPERTLSPDDRLARLLPPTVALPMAAAGIETVEDLYECAAALGNTWFRRIEGLDAALAGELMMWLARWGKSVGEVTPRFFPSGSLPAVRTSAGRRQTDASRGLSAPGDPRIRPIEQIELPEPLSGKKGLNRRRPRLVRSLPAMTWKPSVLGLTLEPGIPIRMRAIERKLNVFCSGVWSKKKRHSRTSAPMKPLSTCAGSKISAEPMTRRSAENGAFRKHSGSAKKIPNDHPQPGGPTMARFRRQAGETPLSSCASSLIF